MQKNIKTLKPLRWLGVIFLAGIFLTSCDGKESKTTTEMQSTEVKTDTLPVLEKDTLITTRPETIKNK